ncbi:hypothetical protein BC937DRAFT_92169 [Endogone sp. FLAS-F59071]|nr:hypothetical protein BC937DRAFT_92169 [Endogone sp. FLAS-F59071]|eukprot:RUS15660.1 hypothetical protein BC937DRAFT_92169 [Endogone sp. FLAS-F59071]
MSTFRLWTLSFVALARQWLVLLCAVPLFHISAWNSKLNSETHCVEIGPGGRPLRLRASAVAMVLSPSGLMNLCRQARLRAKLPRLELGSLAYQQRGKRDERNGYLRKKKKSN